MLFPDVIADFVKLGLLVAFPGICLFLVVKMAHRSAPTMSKRGRKTWIVRNRRLSIATTRSRS